MNIERKVGDIVEGTVVKVYPRYAILLFEDGGTGLLHISELSDSFVRNFTSYVAVGNIYKAKVIEIDQSKSFTKVSLKQMTVEDKRDAMKKSKIDLREVDFTALEARLPDWVRQENEGKGERS